MVTRQSHKKVMNGRPSVRHQSAHSIVVKNWKNAVTNADFGRYY
jgi:hypothetical protein